MPKGGNQTKRKTIEYIKEEVRKIAPNTEILSSEYENNRTKLLFKCECGKVFQKHGTLYMRNAHAGVEAAREKMVG